MSITVHIDRDFTRVIRTEPPGLEDAFRFVNGHLMTTDICSRDDSGDGNIIRHIVMVKVQK